MDILYIVGNKSKCNDFELRCSLRSIDRFGQNIGKVYVVGHCPEWLSDEVVKLPCNDFNKDTDDFVKKAQNIAKKLQYAVENSEIGDEFLVSMDDHFYVKSVDFDSYPCYTKRVKHNGQIPHYIEGATGYNAFIGKVREHLESLELPTYYLAPHRNMPVSRQSLTDCAEIISDCYENDYPMEIFCLLNNYRVSTGEITPVLHEDNKLRSGGDWWRTSPEYDHVFSTPDFEEGSPLYVLISNLYTKKSKYEL